MGDSFSPNVGGSMSDIVKSLTQQLPAYMQAMNSQIAPTEQAKLEAAQQTSPAYNQLLLDLYKQYGPEMAKAGTAVDKTAREGTIKTNADLLTQYGPSLAQAYNRVDEVTNPGVSRVRGEASNKLSELLSSINLGDANPEAERLISQENIRSGTATTPSATNTVSNALSFGDELQKRRNALSNALSVATAFIPAAKSNFDVGANILGTSGQNSGTTQFAGVQRPGNEAFAAGNAALGSATQMRSEQNAADMANYQQGVDMYSRIIPGVDNL